MRTFSSVGLGGSVLAIAAGAAFLTLPGIVSAQQTGSRLGTFIPKTKPELVFNRMAQCYAEKHQRQATEFLDLLPGTAEQDRKFNDMNAALDICINQPNFVFEGQELEFDINRFHRGIAYFVVVGSEARLPTSLPVASDTQPWFRAKLNGVTSANTAALGVEQFGHCVVLRNWSGSRALVVAKTGSKAEATAYKALQNDMNACLSVGQTLKIDKRLVQHVIGDAMYHIAIAPTASSGAGS
jgi:hypothetical protein